MLPVPQTNFATLNFVKWSFGSYHDGKVEIESSGPTPQLHRLVRTVTTQGRILPITPPAANVTWELAFSGPALQCNDIPAAKRDQIWTNMWNAFNCTTDWNPDLTHQSTQPLPYQPHPYLSWIPLSLLESGSGWNGSEDREPELDNRDLPFQFDTSGTCIGSSAAVEPGAATASFLIAVLPKSGILSIDKEYPPRLDITYKPSGGWVYNKSWIGNISGSSDHGPEPYAHFGDPTQSYRVRQLKNISDNLVPWDSAEMPTSPSMVYENSTLLRCDLVNTSYTVSFDYLSGGSNLQITTNDTDQSMRYKEQKDPMKLQQCLQVVTDADVNRPNDGSCNIDPEALRWLSYESIMKAFREVVLGAIFDTHGTQIYNTTITETVLAETAELAFLEDLDHRRQSDKLDFTTAYTRKLNQYSGLWNVKPLDTRSPLKSTLEQLFQNLTISLLADPYFQ